MFFQPAKMDYSVLLCQTLFQVLEVWVNKAGHVYALMELYSNVCTCWGRETAVDKQDHFK